MPFPSFLQKKTADPFSGATAVTLFATTFRSKAPDSSYVGVAGAANEFPHQGIARDPLIVHIEEVL